MKNLACAFAVLICGTVTAQKTPTEIKEETTVKTVTYHNGDSTKEGKIKVVSKETSNVKLDKADANKVNQDRVAATKKLQTTIMVDNDKDAAYDILTKDTYYISANNEYKFSPDESGFIIAMSDDKNKYKDIGKAWTTQSSRNYIIKGKKYDGIGYFDKDGSFTVEYYDDNSKTIKAMKFDEKKDAM